MTLEDSTTIDESITTSVMYGRSTDDAVDIDDSISMRVFIRLTDGARAESVALADLVSFKASIMTLEDSAIVDDSISKRVFYGISDSVIVDESISTSIMYGRSTDDAVDIDDSISKRVLIGLTDGARAESVA